MAPKRRRKRKLTPEEELRREQILAAQKLELERLKLPPRKARRRQS